MSIETRAHGPSLPRDDASERSEGTKRERRAMGRRDLTSRVLDRRRETSNAADDRAVSRRYPLRPRGDSWWVTTRGLGEYGSGLVVSWGGHTCGARAGT